MSKGLYGPKSEANMDGCRGGRTENTQRSGGKWVGYLKGTSRGSNSRLAKMLRARIARQSMSHAIFG